jgi:hypothetical protein
MRARIEDFEDMPEKYLCCEQNIQNMKTYGAFGKVVEIFGEPFIPNSFNCSECGTEFIESVYRMDSTTSFIVLQVGMLDIDEGTEHGPN